jgi:hypothetical protein
MCRLLLDLDSHTDKRKNAEPKKTVPQVFMSILVRDF